MRPKNAPASTVLLALVLGALAPMTYGANLAAQSDEPVVLVHGLNQTGNSWHWLEDDLEDEHPLVALTPTLSSGLSYTVQSIQLSNYLSGLGNDLAAISHSNGGVVVRNYVYGTSSPAFDRHLTIGTPHRGALAATAALDGYIAGWLGAVGQSIYLPFDFYSHHDPEWPNLTLWGEQATVIQGTASFLIANLVSPLPQGMRQMGIDILTDDYDEILEELRPTSSTFSTLNYPTIIAQEAAKLDEARVSISTEYPDQYALWRPMFSNDFSAVAFDQNEVGYLMFFAMEFYNYYTFHPNAELRSSAYLWEDMAMMLFSLPIQWQEFIGGLAEPDDGLLPESTTEYPGGLSLSVPLNQKWTHHVAQLDDFPDTHPLRALIHQAVETQLGITDPPPPDTIPLDVSIQGPIEIQPDATCTWSASVTGGTPPLTYGWYNEGVSVASGPSYVGGKLPDNQGDEFTLELRVWSSDPGYGEATILVSENPAAPPCFN